MSEPVAKTPRALVRSGYESRLAERRADAMAARRSGGAHLERAPRGVRAGRRAGRSRLRNGAARPALAARARSRLHRARGRARPGAAPGRDARALGPLLRGRDRATRCPLRGTRCERRAFPRPRAPVCRRSRSLRRGRALRAAVPRAHGRGRGDACGLAARAGAQRRSARPPDGRPRAAPARRICANRWCSSGDAVATGLHAESLERWGESAPPAPAPALRAIARGAVGALGGARRGDARRRAAPDPVARGARSGRPSRRRDCAVACDARWPRRRLPRASSPCSRGCSPCSRASRFAAPRLVALREQIATGGAPASREIARLKTLVDLLDARRNQIFAPIGAALLFTTQVALAIDAWRARCGPSLRAWIDATAELEALASLATHAHEHPEDVFPELADGPAPLRSRGPRPSAAPRFRGACATTCASATRRACCW